MGYIADKLVRFFPQKGEPIYKPLRSFFYYRYQMNINSKACMHAHFENSFSFSTSRSELNISLKMQRIWVEGGKDMFQKNWQNFFINDILVISNTDIVKMPVSQGTARYFWFFNSGLFQIGSKWQIIYMGTKVGHIPLHLLQPWQARFLWG